MKSIHRLCTARRLFLNPQPPITTLFNSHLRTSLPSKRPFSVASIKSSQAAASRTHPSESSQSSDTSSRPQKPLFPENPRAKELDNEYPDFLNDVTSYALADEAYRQSQRRRRPAGYGITDHSDNDAFAGALRKEYVPRPFMGQSYPMSRPSLMLPVADPAQSYLDRLKELDHSVGLSPRLGTRIYVKNSADLPVKVRQLTALAIQNRIPYVANRQRFHERPGLKRKRLKRERWRRRFMGTFKKICERVTHLSKQGW
jgi:hypothetical protein